MIRRAAAVFAVILVLVCPAAAQEPVTVATTRDLTNGALFLAAARGYFAAEGLQLKMRAYPDAAAAVEALGLGDADLALTRFNAKAFKLAAGGKVKAIAAQVREWPGYEGNEVVASDAAAARGLHTFADLAGKSIGITKLGSIFHYELALIARRKHFSFDGVALKTLQTCGAVAQAVATNKIDAAILPPLFARELLMGGEARPVGWYSELDRQQLGALFASPRTLAKRRGMVEKFLRAYRHGSMAYAMALMRHDSAGKRIFDAKTRSVAGEIGFYVFPGYPARRTARVVAGAAYYMDPEARLDLTDLARQVAWYKAQGLIGKSADVRTMVDLKEIAAR